MTVGLETPAERARWDTYLGYRGTRLGALNRDPGFRGRDRGRPSSATSDRNASGPSAPPVRSSRSAPPGPPILGGERVVPSRAAVLKRAIARLLPGLGGRGGRAGGRTAKTRPCPPPSARASAAP